MFIIKIEDYVPIKVITLGLGLFKNGDIAWKWSVVEHDRQHTWYFSLLVVCMVGPIKEAHSRQNCSYAYCLCYSAKQYQCKKNQSENIPCSGVTYFYMKASKILRIVGLGSASLYRNV